MGADTSLAYRHRMGVLVVTETPMKIIKRCPVVISFIFALCATLITWLVLSENSPLDNYFLYHTTVRNLVGRLVFLPYAAVLLIRPSFWADQISYALIFLQWLLVGFLISVIVCRRRN